VPTTAGDIYTVAENGTPGFSGDGHAAVGAELDQPFGVGIDSAGNLLVADVASQRRVSFPALPATTGCGRPWERAVSPSAPAAAAPGRS